MRRRPLDPGVALFFVWCLLVLALTFTFFLANAGCGLTGKGGAPTCPAHLAPAQGTPGPGPASCPDVRR